MAIAQMRTPHHTAELASELADPPLTIKECFRTRLKMDDENYRNVLNWYKSCIKLGETKSGRQKDAFTMRLIQNLLRSTSEFFGVTKLSQETVEKIENECASMVDRILYPSDILPKNDFGTENLGDILGKTVANCTKSGDNLMARLLKHIQWTAIIASILILLILLILLYFCIALRACPRRKCDCPCDKCDDQEQRTSKNANKSRFSCRPERKKRKKFNKQICDEDEDEDDVNLITRKSETTHTSTNVAFSTITTQPVEGICSCDESTVDIQQTTSTNFKVNRASGGETELDLK